MWLDNILESVRAFSFQSVLRGNVLSSPGAFGGSNGTNGIGGNKSNSPASQMVNNRYLSSYYKIHREINDYEISELTDTCLTIYTDYITGYFDDNNELFTISDALENHDQIQNWICKVYEDDLKIRDEVKTHLRDIIYKGSYSFKIAWDPEHQKYIKFFLYNPHNVVTVYKDKHQESHLVVSRDGVIFQVKPESIFRIGRTKLTLINDINTNFYERKPEDTLVNDEEFKGAIPLYFNIRGKIKEYLLKEQILSLLSIKDLVQPLLLLVRLDKNTAPDEGNKLALNIENMINKYSDISSILSSNFSINGLIDSLMHNIRVIPDYASSMGDMNNVDLSKITNKIQEIEQSQDGKLDNILTALTIPKALRDGNSSKWDALKSSQRLNSKINSFIIDIRDSLIEEAVKLIYDKFHILVDAKYITCNLFKKTDVDYNVSITNSQIISELTQGIQQILSSGNQLLQEIPFIDKKSYLSYLSDQLKSIDPDVAKFMNEQVIQEFLSKPADSEGGQDQQPQ